MHALPFKFGIVIALAIELVFDAINFPNDGFTDLSSKQCLDLGQTLHLRSDLGSILSRDGRLDLSKVDEILCALLLTNRAALHELG